ncbi:hypothetical protein D3C73_1386380 [compost metagenome]
MVVTVWFAIWVVDAVPAYSTLPLTSTSTPAFAAGAVGVVGCSGATLVSSLSIKLGVTALETEDEMLLPTSLIAFTVKV